MQRTWGWDEGFQRGYFDEHFDPAKRRIVVVDGIGVLQTEQREVSKAAAWGKIVEDVLAGARAQELPVTLQVLRENPKTRSLCERLGFVLRELRTPENF